MTLCTQQAAAAAVLVYLCSALLALQSLVSSRGEGEGEGDGDGEERTASLLLTVGVTCVEFGLDVWCL
jgi:hypothetical protein